MPVINNAYKIDDDNYAFSPSDMDSKHPNLTNKEISSLVDSLCDVRMENPDVVLLDKINNRRINPIEQERLELEQDSIAVEEEVLRDIFESGSPMTIEERNELVAKGLYDKYQEMKSRKINKSQYQTNLDNTDISASMEAELMASMNTPLSGDIESITEVISEEVEEQSFPEPVQEVKTSNETETTTFSPEDIDISTVKEAAEAWEITNNNIKAIFGDEPPKITNNSLNTIFDKMDPPKLEYDLTEEELNAMAKCDTLAIDAMEEPDEPALTEYEIEGATSATEVQEIMKKVVNGEYTISEEEAIKMAQLDTLGREEYEEKDIVNEFAAEHMESTKEKPHLSKEQIAKVIGAVPTAAAVLANPTGEGESLEEITEQLTNTLDVISDPNELVGALESHIEETVEEESEPMSIEEFNDVPATNIDLSDDKITKALMEQYEDVDARDAAQLITVMNRYKSGEKFNVFDALPDSLKNIINKEAMAVGADRSTINFFAKSFINDLVNNTFLEQEIQDFNKDLAEVMAPMGNIAGTMMDEYNDEVYDKFTTDLIAKSELLRYADEPNVEKADQLVRIANNFTEAVKMTRLIKFVKEKPSFINRYYKNSRDNWNKIVADFDIKASTVSPRPRDLMSCYNGLISAGCEDYVARTITALAADSVINAINDGSLEEHVYGYYLTNSLMTLGITANTSRIVADIKDAVNELDLIITKTMLPLIARNTKKQRKRNKRR